jgi:4-hydroxymandelate oxidase
MKNLLGDSLPHSELRGHVEPRLRDDGGLKRRELLKASMVIGAGVVGQMMAPSAASAQAPPQQNIAPAKSGKGQLTEQQVLDNARERLYPTCRVCPVCDGVACAGDGGGMAGAGTGVSFQNNFTALQRVKFMMRNVHEHEVSKVDTSTTIFGHKISFPAVSAPMGPNGSTFGKGMPVADWFNSLIGGCNAAGTLGSVGDDPRYEDAGVRSNLLIIKAHKGQALYNSKPAPNPIILKYLPLIEEVSPAWLSIDVDSGPKSVGELRELVRAFHIPIVVKGIMKVDDAMRCVDAGVAGIAVSNHGGRRLDHAAGIADVLSAVAAKLKGQVPILTDGCVATGADVLKYLALGADVVMVGRHLLRAAHGSGPEGVALFMNKMRSEFESAMLLTGVLSVPKINNSILYA